MAELKLSNHSKRVKIADADVVWASQHSWFAKKSHKGLWYVATSVRVGKKVHTVYLHRQVVQCPDGLTADYLDGDTFNAMPENLEIVTLEENTRRRWARVRAEAEGRVYDPHNDEEDLPF